MIDFFTALLDPQLAKTPALVPRLPALFEPLTPRDELGMAVEASESETRKATPTRTQRNVRFTDSEARQEPAREREPYRGVMNPPPLLRTVPSADAVIPLNYNTLRATEAIAKSPEPSPSRAEEANLRPTQAPEPSASTEQGRAASAVISPIRPAPFVESRRTGTRGESEPQGNVAPAPAPIVKVTIGRIVVRAVSPTPAAPAKRLVGSKKLSLDDYLSKGKRGER